MKNVSWESHRIGFVLGILFSIIFRSKGPQKKVYDWGEDEDEDDDNNDSSFIENNRYQIYIKIVVIQFIFYKSL